MTKVENMNMDELRSEYTEIRTRYQENSERSDNLMEQMNKICDVRAKEFKRVVNEIFDGNDDWTLFEVRGSASIDHRERPVRVETGIKVECGYYRENQRGSIVLYGDIGEADELRAELDRLINGSIV